MKGRKTSNFSLYSQIVDTLIWGIQTIIADNYVGIFALIGQFIDEKFANFL